LSISEPGRPLGADRVRKAMAILAGTIWLVSAPMAHASLGRTRETVEMDRARFGAQMSSTTTSAYTLHTLTLPSGAVVREFTREDGVVFAVSWRGAGRPDLRQLLGDGFDTMQADIATRRPRVHRMPLAVNRADLVVHTGGHPGAFWGSAYLPQQVPAGFSGKDMR